MCENQGGCKLSGRSHNERTSYAAYKYKGGDVLYSLRNAREGVLRKVVIKYLKSTGVESGMIRGIYVDTLNASWNEWDLIDLETAKHLAVRYFENEIRKIQMI